MHVSYAAFLWAGEDVFTTSLFPCQYYVIMNVFGKKLLIGCGHGL